MPKKTSKTKSTRAKQKSSTAPHGVRPSAGIIFTLIIALIVAITIGVVSFNRLKSSDAALANAKLAVFDNIASEYIREYDITPDNGVKEYYQMTGYGISSEDGVFYITFDFVDPAAAVIASDEAGNQVIENAQHGIMYFWEDSERPGHYSHAYSYHDDNYHPDGIYVEISQQ